MKHKLLYLSAAAIFFVTSCDQSGESAVESKDSVIVAADEPLAPDNNVSPYRDLKTNSPVFIDHDSVTHTYVNRDTRQPLAYYYDPITNDTFDARGRIVNNALTLTNGDYTIDEAKVKSNDDKFKAKYEDMKVKVKDDKYKEKTEDSKVKIEDDEVKVKDK